MSLEKDTQADTQENFQNDFEDEIDDYYYDNFYNNDIDASQKLELLDSLIKNAIEKNNNLSNNKYLDFFKLIIRGIFKYDTYLFEQLVSKKKIRKIRTDYSEEFEDDNIHIYVDIKFKYNKDKSLLVICKGIPDVNHGTSNAFLDLNESEKELYVSSIQTLNRDRDFDLLLKLIYALRNEIKEKALQAALEKPSESDSYEYSEADN